MLQHERKRSALETFAIIVDNFGAIWARDARLIPSPWASFASLPFLFVFDGIKFINYKQLSLRAVFYESIDLFDLPFLDSFLLFFFDDNFLGGATWSSSGAFHLRLGGRGWEFQILEFFVRQAALVEVSAGDENCWGDSLKLRKLGQLLTSLEHSWASHKTSFCHWRLARACSRFCAAYRRWCTRRSTGSRSGQHIAGEIRRRTRWPFGSWIGKHLKRWSNYSPFITRFPWNGVERLTNVKVRRLIRFLRSLDLNVQWSQCEEAHRR